jgi:signal transduction histidine kinase
MNLFNFPGNANDPLKLLQTEMVFKGTSRTLSIGILGVWIIVVVAWGQGQSWGHRLAILTWAVALSLVLLRGVKLARLFQSKKRGVEDIDSWSKLLVQNGIVAAILWGSSSFVMLPATSLEREAVLIVAIAMVIMAGAQAIYLPVVQVFVLLTSILFALGLFVLADTFHIYLGVAFLLFATVITLFGRNQDHVLRRAIQLSMEKERLLREGTTRQHESEAARKHAEQAKAEAEQATLSKTRFFAAASHDLRQPMHALGFYAADLVRRTKDSSLLDTTMKIQAAAKAMEELLNAVLDFSRISFGLVTVRTIDFSLDGLFASLENQLQPEATHKGVLLIIQRCGLVARSDPMLLERILRNIAANGIRYTERGCVGIQAKRTRGTIAIRVYDTGLGIPQKERAAIFEEFYQLANSERDRAKGLGLGLAIVKQLAELLGHRLVVRSKVAKGSIFTVEVPEGSMPTQLPAATIGHHRSAGLAIGACVVLVEDDPMGLDGMATALRGYGCHVVFAFSGVEAVAKLATSDRTPNLIIADFRLKNGETGFDAVDSIRRSQGLDPQDCPDLPAILVSGDTLPDKVASTHQGIRILRKPVDPLLLLQTIEEYLEPFARRIGLR